MQRDWRACKFKELHGVSVVGLTEAHEGEEEDKAWRGPQSQNTSYAMEGVGVLSVGNLTRM